MESDHPKEESRRHRAKLESDGIPIPISNHGSSNHSATSLDEFLNDQTSSLNRLLFIIIFPLILATIASVVYVTFLLVNGILWCDSYDAWQDEILILHSESVYNLFHLSNVDERNPISVAEFLKENPICKDAKNPNKLCSITTSIEVQNNTDGFNCKYHDKSTAREKYYKCYIIKYRIRSPTLNTNWWNPQIAFTAKIADELLEVNQDYDPIVEYQGSNNVFIRKCMIRQCKWISPELLQRKQDKYNEFTEALSLSNRPELLIN